MRRHAWHGFVIWRGTRAVVAAALTCLVVAAASCRSARTVTVEVPVPVHDTTYVTNTVRDSVFVENTVTEYVKGDTVYLTKTVVKYVERLKMDTVSVYVEKPVEIVRTEEKVVEKPLNWLQRTMMGLGAFLIGGIVCFLVILGIKTKM